MERNTLRWVSSWRNYSDCRFYRQRKSATALRLTLYPIFRTSSEWNSFATTFYRFILMQTPLFLRLFGLNVLLHHLRPQTYVSHLISISTHYFTARILIFLYLYLHCRKYRMRPTSKGEASLHGGLENLLKSKKRTSSSQKLDSAGLTWFRESISFYQCPINFYQTQALSSLSPALTTPLATSVSVAIIAQNNGH
jgi:hypothetical protein